MKDEYACHKSDPLTLLLYDEETEPGVKEEDKNGRAF
jgi:hypothetical protein